MKIYLLWGKSNWGDPKFSTDNGLLGIHIDLEVALKCADAMNSRPGTGSGPAAVMEFDLETQARRWVYINARDGTRQPMLEVK